MGKAACGMILNPQNQVLLQRKDGGSWFWPNYWCCFGGKVEDGESPLEAFEREIREEIGINISKIKFFAKHNVTEIAKAGPEKGIRKKETEVYYYVARFDGNLKNIKFGEGAGFSLFDEEEVVRYNEMNLVVHPNYEMIKEFYKQMRDGAFLF